MLPSALDSVGQAIKARDQNLFRSRYDGLIETCNSCHASAHHAFIRVAVPTGSSSFWNQQFEHR